MTGRKGTGQTPLPDDDDDDISIASTLGEENDTDKEYDVERILAEKGPKTNKYFLIRWLGYPEEMSTWEPKDNIGPDILDCWLERKMREENGIDEPFDVSGFEARIKRLAQEKAERHRRRVAKRKRLRLQTGMRRSDVQKADDSDSSTEAVEHNEVEDDPGMKLKRKGRQNKSTLKKQQKPFKVVIKGESFQEVDDTSPDLESNAKGSPKRTQVSLATFSTGGAQRPSRLPEKEKHTRTLSQSTSDVPLAKERGQQQQPGSSSSDRPLAQRHLQRNVVPQAPSTTARQTSPCSLDGEEEPVKRGRRRPRGSTSTRGNAATRGGSNLVHKNVFETREQPKKRGNLLRNAMDTTKDPKGFSTMRLRRKAELQGRDMAEAAPDISAIGGLFDPSDPSSFQPIKLDMLRKSTSKRIQPEAEQDSDIGYGNLDVPFENEEDSPNPEAPQAPPPRATFQYQPEYPRSVCFYWDREQRDSKWPPCTRGSDCKYLHYYKEGAPIAPAPQTNSRSVSRQNDNAEQVRSAETVHNQDPPIRYPWQVDSFADDVSVGSPPDKLAVPPWRSDSRSGEVISTQPQVVRPPWQADTSSTDVDPTSASDLFVSPSRKSSLPVAVPPTSSTQPPLQRRSSAIDIDFVQSPRLSAGSQLHQDNVSDEISTVRSESLRIRPAWDPSNPLNAVCYFWHAQGRCTRGDSCKYYHSSDVKLPVAPDPRRQASQQTCKFWLAGHCKNPAARCGYLHENIPSYNSEPDQDALFATPQSLENVPMVGLPTPSVPRTKSVKFAIDESTLFSEEPDSISSASRNAGTREVPSSSQWIPRVCRHWERGACSFGSICRNLHESPRPEDSRQQNMDFEMQHGNREGHARPIPELQLSDATRKIISGFMSPSEPQALKPALKRIQSEATPLEVGQQTANVAPEVLAPISGSPLVPGSMFPASKVKSKMKTDDYRRKKVLEGLGARAKEVTFGSDEKQSFVLDFGDVEQSQASWKQTFSSLSKLAFDQLCMVQDFRLQQGFLQRRELWQGSVGSADPGDAKALEAIDKVVKELVLRSAGLMATFAEFAILLFPAKKEEWKFLERSFEYPKEVRLRYFIFEPDLSLKHRAEMSAPLPSGEPYKMTLVSKIHDLHLERLLPLCSTGQNPYKFYLLFPSSESQTADFFASWIRASHSDSQIYSSQIQGSWDFFLNNAESIGVILIHESAAADIYRLPSLARTLADRKKTFVFWNLSDSSSPYPIFPSRYDHAESHVGRLTLTRLFPHGCAFFLTPSFLIAEPMFAYEIVKWFLCGSKAKYINSTAGTWKLVVCHKFSNYLLDVANSKASEKEDFEAKNKDNPAKDDMLNKKHLSFSHCETRYKMHRALAAWQTKYVYAETSSSDMDSEFTDDIDSPIVYAPKSIDPDDEKALVEWFAGWSIQKLDLYRKFAVIGTASLHTGRASRIKEFRIRQTDGAIEPSSVSTPAMKPFSMTKKAANNPDIHPRLTVSPINPQKQRALEIAAKLKAFSPNKATTSAKNQERIPVEDASASPIAAQLASRKDDSDIEMTDINVTSTSTTKRGIDESLDRDVFTFVAKTSSTTEAAKNFLARGNNNLHQAIENCETQDLDSQVTDPINIISSRQAPGLAMAEEDVVRANQLYASPSMSLPPTSILSDVTNNSNSAQLDGADDYFSPQYDGADDRPASSGTESSKMSRSGILSDENGQRFVPRPVRSDNGIRRETAVKPGFVLDDDKEAYKDCRIKDGIPQYEVGSSREGSKVSSRRGSVDSPRGGVASSVNSGSERPPKRSRWEPEVKKEIMYEATSAWYKKLTEQGEWWQHILLLTGWDDIKGYLGMK